MNKILSILFATIFAAITYSQNKEQLSTVQHPENPSAEKTFFATNDGTLRIAASGSIRIFEGGSLTAKSEITNLGNGDNFTVDSDANLLQTNDAAINSGGITAKRDIKISADRKQYNYLGTPVAFKAGQTYKTIYAGITYAIYHNQATGFFYNSTGTNVPGRGLGVKEPTLAALPSGTKTTAVYLGVPQNGQIILPVANSNTGLDAFGYNLVGNPYASNIDLEKLYDLNGAANISATFYFWDNTNNDKFEQQGSEYEGQAYAIYNAIAGGGTGLGTKSHAGTKVPTNIVKVGQGFMIKSLKSTHDFKFDNSIRTAQSSPVDFLGKNAVDRYWLQMTVPSGINSSLAVVYYEGGNNLLGLEDSKSVEGSDAIYSLIENDKIGINGRNNFVDTDVIPLGSQHFAAGRYKIELAQTEGIFANGQTIYLKDRETGITTNLSQGDYTFTANPGENTGRFEVLYKPGGVLATDTAVKEALTVYKDQHDFVVVSNGKKISVIQVFDASGRLIYTGEPNAGKASVNSAGWARGIYILKIDRSGEITSKKILR